MEKKLRHLRNFLIDSEADALLLSDVANISYLTGYTGFTKIEREAFLLISSDKAYIFTDGRYSEAITKEVPHFSLVETTPDSPFMKNLEKIVRKHNLVTIGFEDIDITVNEFVRLKKLPITLKAVSLRTLRIKKTPSEIEAITKACGIADKAFAAVQNKIKPGITEIELAYLLENDMRKQFSQPSFPTIAAFGDRAAIPHYQTGKKILKKNDVILLDFGATYSHYCSDTTRTFFIGTVPAEVQKAYKTVYDAQQKAFDYLSEALRSKKEAHASEVDKTARECILSKGFSTIPHSLGHGIGLSVHEAPIISPKSKDILTDGMVFSIEPGIYLPGKFGIRIEDLFAIKGSELIRLTHAPKVQI